MRLPCVLVNMFVCCTRLDVEGTSSWSILAESAWLIKQISSRPLKEPTRVLAHDGEKLWEPAVMPLDCQSGCLALLPKLIHCVDGAAKLAGKPWGLELFGADCRGPGRHKGAHRERSFVLGAVPPQVWKWVLRSQITPQLRARLEVNDRVFFQACLLIWSPPVRLELKYLNFRVPPVFLCCLFVLSLLRWSPQQAERQRHEERTQKKQKNKQSKTKQNKAKPN